MEAAEAAEARVASLVSERDEATTKLAATQSEKEAVEAAVGEAGYQLA